MAQLFRTLRRKFGIAAPRVSVQTHVAWYWRWLGIIALGAFVVGVGWTTYDYGMELAGFRQGEAASMGYGRRLPAGAVSDPRLFGLARRVAARRFASPTALCDSLGVD